MVCVCVWETARSKMGVRKQPGRGRTPPWTSESGFTQLLHFSSEWRTDGVMKTTTPVRVIPVGILRGSTKQKKIQGFFFFFTQGERRSSLTEELLFPALCMAACVCSKCQSNFHGGSERGDLEPRAVVSLESWNHAATLSPL